MTERPPESPSTAAAVETRRTVVGYALGKSTSEDAGMDQSGSGGMTRSAVSPLATAR